MSQNEIASDGPRICTLVHLGSILNWSDVLEVKSGAGHFDLPRRTSPISRDQKHVVHVNLSFSAREKIWRNDLVLISLGTNIVACLEFIRALGSLQRFARTSTARSLYIVHEDAVQQLSTKLVKSCFIS